MSEVAPNLAHVVPDTKKQLKGDDLTDFFQQIDTKNSLSSPYYTLLPSNVPKSSPSSPLGQRTEHAELHPTYLQNDGIDAMYIDNVLSQEECDYLCNRIDCSNALSFWSAAGRQNEAARQFRDANTVEMEAPELSEVIYNRIKHLIIRPDAAAVDGGDSAADHGMCPPSIDITPPVSVEYEIGSEYYLQHKDDHDSTLYEKNLVGSWIPIGLNPDLLLAQYPIGGSFAPHTDGRAIRDFNTGSFYSALVYLSTIPEGHGGGTRFYKDEALTHLIKKKEEEEGKQRDYVGTSDKTNEGRWTVDDSYLLAGTREKSTVCAVAGRVLIFNQKLAHEGLPTTLPADIKAAHADSICTGNCTDGKICTDANNEDERCACRAIRKYTKYIIRSDVMYQRIPQLFTSERDIQAYKLFREAEQLAEACPMQINANNKDDGEDEDEISNVEKSIILFKKAMRLSPDLAIFCGYM